MLALSVTLGWAKGSFTSLGLGFVGTLIYTFVLSSIDLFEASLQVFLLFHTQPGCFLVSDSVPTRSTL